MDNPLNQEVFRTLTAPQKLAKGNKRASQVQCSTCYTSGRKLLTCQRCKSVWYCSKECQKKNWPCHKTLCTTAERPKGIGKLVGRIVCNVSLITMLQSCAALDLNIPEDNRRELGFKYPFITRVDIAVEPCNIHKFVKLFSTNEPIPGEIQGMIQLNRFHSYVPGKAGQAPLTPVGDNMWRTERARLNETGHRNDPLGLLEFVNNDNNFSIATPLPIWTVPTKWDREKEPFMTPYGPFSINSKKPMTVATCMEFINMHIRLDKQNQLKMRAEMTDTDKLIIRAARDKFATSEAVVALREKIAREAIYANIRLG